MPTFEEELALIGSGNLADKIFAFQDHRKLIGFMVAAQGLMTDGDGKKTGETESFVVAGRFQVAPQGLGANVDAKYCLGLRADFALVWRFVRVARGLGRIPARRKLSESASLEPQLVQKLFLITGLEGLEPNRTVLGLGKTVHPIQ